MICRDCLYFRENTIQDNHPMTLYQKDHRPEIKSFWDFFRFMWNPTRFKIEPDDFEIAIYEAFTNQEKTTCHYNPQPIHVDPNSFCSNWKDQ
jgi:hypothetical protein